MVFCSNTLISLLREKPAVAVLTGAGISAESGVPTFRGENGLWKKLKPEELANFDAFMKNPEMVWEWYQHRQQIIRDVNPNPGHFALAEFERICSRFYLITQNVDNLHKRAGSSHPIELHGNIMRNRCLDCGAVYEDEDVVIEAGIPRCAECGGMLRPNVVWFGEMLPHQALIEAEEGITTADVFFSVGTSALVQPAASMPVWAKQRGAYLVEVNTEETPLTEIADEVLKGSAGEVLPRLLNSVQG